MPSIAAGIRRPCQWMVVVSSSAFEKWTITRLPTRARISGPGTCPLYVQTVVGPPETNDIGVIRACSATSTMFGSGFMSSAAGIRTPSSQPTGCPGAPGPVGFGMHPIDSATPSPTWTCFDTTGGGSTGRARLPARNRGQNAQDLRMAGRLPRALRAEFRSRLPDPDEATVLHQHGNPVEPCGAPRRATSGRGAAVGAPRFPGRRGPDGREGGGGREGGMGGEGGGCDAAAAG